MKILRFYPLILLILALIWFQDLNSRPLHTILILLIPAFVLLAVLLLCLVLGKICVPKTVGRAPASTRSSLCRTTRRSEETAGDSGFGGAHRYFLLYVSVEEWESGTAKDRTGPRLHEYGVFRLYERGKALPYGWS